MISRFVTFCGLLALTFPMQAEAVQAVHATVDLRSDTSLVVPGETFHLGVTFALEPHWHIYWKNPGASGLPPEFTWNLPDGFKVGEIQWPVPNSISLEGLVSYGYEDVVTFIVPVTAPDGLAPGSEIPIQLDIFYLTCKEVCLPGEATADLTLAVGESVQAQNQDVFESARQSQPQPDSPFELAATALEEKTLTVEIKGDALPEELYFFAAREGMVDPNATQSYTIEDGVGRLYLNLDYAYFENGATGLSGVLQSAKTSWEVTIPRYQQAETTAEAEVSTEPTVKAYETTAGTLQKFENWLIDSGLVGWLLAAFLGGVILNIMPCVLPVLSLKVFSLLNHSGESRAQAIAHGAAYTLGVVVSFLVLAGVLFSLRALGESIGWGFQLQNPGFVLILGVVFFLFGLNLMGVFEIGSGLVGADTKVAGRKDLVGSFGVGVLAAVVGAPCVGPLVGGVSGVALQANTVTGLLVFGMMGFGMAFPFLILAIFPRLVAYLPKPGAWMETFKQAMGFLLMAALIFLVFLMGRLVNADAITAMLVVLLTASIAAWVFGRWAAPSKSARSKGVARFVAVALLVISGGWGLRAVDRAYLQSLEVGEKINAEVAEGEPWAPWSPEAVQESLSEGKPVFVDFTATWCLICQVNKKTALRTDATRQLFEENDVVSLSADWTRRDAVITAELEKFGRSGVPLYLLYSPDGKVSVLPQNLTNGIIRNAVEAL